MYVPLAAVVALKLAESAPLSVIVMVREGGGGVRLPDRSIGTPIDTEFIGQASDTVVGTDTGWATVTMHASERAAATAASPA